MNFDLLIFFSVKTPLSEVLFYERNLFLEDQFQTIIELFYYLDVVPEFVFVSQ